MTRDELILNNINLVRSVVNKNFTGYDDKEDLFQVGCIGLIKAADNFDPNKGIKFSTYATHRIYGEIRNYNRDNTPIHVTRSLKENLVLINREREKYIVTFGKEPSILELSNILDMTPEKISECLMSTWEIESLDKSAVDSNKPRINMDDNEINLIDTIEDTYKNELLELDSFLDGVTEKYKKVLKLKFFGGFSQSQIGEILKVHQFTVSKYERFGKQELKEIIKGGAI